MPNLLYISIMATETDVKIDKDIEELLNSITAKEPMWNVIVFNDEVHSMQEVVIQIMRATECDARKATKLMLDVHLKGQAMVKAGSHEECFKVRRILEEIDLLTDMVQV